MSGQIIPMQWNETNHRTCLVEESTSARVPTRCLILPGPPGLNRGNPRRRSTLNLFGHMVIERFEAPVPLSLRQTGSRGDYVSEGRVFSDF